METNIMICKIDSQWQFAVCLRKLKQGLYISLEGWYGEGDGRKGTYTYLWLIHVSVWQKTTKFCKTIILQLKNRFKKKKLLIEILVSLLFLTSMHTHTHSYTLFERKRKDTGNESQSVFAQLCPTLCNPMDCSPPGSSVHGILQVSILEWIGVPFSRGSSWPRDWTGVSWIAGRFFTI